MGDLTRVVFQQSREKIDWMWASQNIQRHAIYCIMGSTPQAPVLRFARSIVGSSGPSLQIGRPLRTAFVGVIIAGLQLRSKRGATTSTYSLQISFPKWNKVQTLIRVDISVYRI